MQIETKQFYDALRFPGLYTQESIDYHLDGIKNPYLDIIDSALGQKKSVLDVGCGSGYITNLFSQIYDQSQFTAIDFAAGADYGREFSEKHDRKNITWVKDDFLSHCFPTQFDVVICQGVFHHIKDQTTALSKLKSLCKPGGNIIFGVYHPAGKVLKRWININYFSNVLEEDQENNPFETAFTCAQVQEMFGDYELTKSYPLVTPVISDLVSFFNFRNGGLITYLFQKKH